MTIDATVAGASADSYLDVAAADALAAARLGPFAEAWPSLTVDVKERALKEATDDIDAFVRVGVPYSSTQTLRFPREIDLDTSDNPIILAKVAEACFEQAAYLAATASERGQHAIRRARGLISFSESNVSGSLADDSSFGWLVPRAEALLRSIVTTRSGFTGSVRVRSAVLSAYEAGE